MKNTPIFSIYDIVAEAHAKIQQDFKNIDPVVGINRQMRTVGIEADAMTIDCLKTGKRILLVFHDAQPDVASYQFCLRDEDPFDEFESITLEKLTVQRLYAWMKQNFSVPHKPDA